ncbi:hypothetical protein ACWGM5_20710, partial [Bacillus velezensis]
LNRRLELRYHLMHGLAGLLVEASCRRSRRAAVATFACARTRPGARPRTLASTRIRTVAIPVTFTVTVTTSRPGTATTVSTTTISTTAISATIPAAVAWASTATVTAALARLGSFWRG